jgi:hypothetical protein
MEVAIFDWDAPNDLNSGSSVESILLAVLGREDFFLVVQEDKDDLFLRPLTFVLEESLFDLPPRNPPAWVEGASDPLVMDTAMLVTLSCLPFFVKGLTWSSSVILS